MKNLKFIEFSSKGTIIFVAGGDENKQEGASIAAVKFSSNIKLINEFQIKDGGNLVYSLKRHENGNILFAGTTSKIFILFFDGAVFDTIAEYSNLPLDSITHLQNLDEELYCASPERECLLKLIYASKGVIVVNKEKPKVEKAVQMQFTVSTKKTVSIPSKVTWMKLSPQKKEALMKILGKLNILGKIDGKNVIDFSQTTLDTGKN